MKPIFRLRSPRFPALLALLLGLLLAACGGNADQKAAYTRATELEAHYTTETAPEILAAYRRVIALDPDSKWARRAEERLAAVEARQEADERHKEVFQEHGID